MNDQKARQAVLITGATGGIGQVVVESLAEHGFAPVIHFSKQEGFANQLLGRIGGKGWVIQSDLSEKDGARKLWDGTLHVAGRIYGLINNAGIRSTVRLEDDWQTWHSGWEKDFQVNLFSAVDLCRAAIAHFRESGGGRIVNIASRAGQRGYAADYMPYGAAKAALMNVTKSIARNHGGEGISAVTISPGFVRSEMAEEYIRNHGLEAAVGDIPIKAMVEPQEIADVILLCLRENQRSINGATIDINGGSYIR